LLFVFENLVRELVVSTFSDLDGPDWFDKRASSDMKRKVEQRKLSEERASWHVGRNAGEVFYLDFGDLGLLIANHWAAFREFFETQAWVSSRILEAERTRNVIAHTNVLDEDEGLRLEMHIRDWIRQVG
jgi:hypothetical protein